MKTLHHFSLATTPIEILDFQENKLSDATAFFYESLDSKLFLVTNWHVVTGRTLENPTHSENGVIPCFLRARLHKRQQKLNGKSVIHTSELTKVTIKINSNSGNEPSWTEHPTLGSTVDVVCIEIPPSENFKEKIAFSLVNKWKEYHDAYEPEAMDDAFVIGYPWGISGSGVEGAIPLYKKGCIASDPVIDHGGKPKILIDCRTTSGMSGSPVIASRTGLFHPEGKFSDSTTFGTTSKFIGVYSGRLYNQFSPRDVGVDREVSEIGVVWKAQVLDEVARNGVQGSRLIDILNLSKESINSENSDN